MIRRPIIGLNMSMDLIDKYEKYGLLVPISYVDAVAGAGGVPLCLPPCEDFTAIHALMPIIDGIILIGGDDYWPDHFAGHPQPEDELMPKRRDRFDLELAKEVLHKTTLPILGICGGHQLISIAQGGALIQDIKTEWDVPVGSSHIPHSRKERGIVALVFRCRAIGGTLTENPEVTGFRWVQESEVSGIMSEAFAIRILDAYRHDAEPSVRDHDGVRLVAPRAN